jgi:transposase InsO family protein
MDKRALNPKIRQAIADFDLDGAPRGGVSMFCAAHAISRSVFYKIKHQANTSGQARYLLPGKSGPPTQPRRTDPDMERLVIHTRLELKKDGWDHGPVSVRARLVRAGYSNVPSRATLARIFTRHDLVSPEPNKRPRSATKRFAFPNANDMWQLDGTEWHLDDEHNTKQVIYQVEDDHSRMILSWAMDTTENGHTAIKVVSEAIRHHGIPLRFLTDNATAFNMHRRGLTAPLERYLKSFGVITISGSIARPTTQGKNERLHSTLLNYLRAHQPITTPEHLAALLADFAHKYNTERPHQELPDLQTPAEAYNLATKAGPPTPPEPTSPNQPHDHPNRRRPYGAYQVGNLLMANRTVDQTGRVSIANCHINVGKNKAGQQLRITITQDYLELFGPNGQPLGLVRRPPPTTKRVNLNLYSHGIHCA